MRKIIITFTLLAAVLLSAGTAQASLIFPDNWQSYNPVGAIPGDRSDPTQALTYNPANDDVPPINFVSLGFGGELILTFSQTLVNGAGNDLAIWESTWGSNADNWNSYKETAEVFVWDQNAFGAYAGQNSAAPGWVSLGLAKQDGVFDFGSVGRTTAVLITDVSLANGFTGGGDGYDVDAVAGYYTPLPAAVWLFGGGLMALFGVRRARRD